MSNFAKAIGNIEGRFANYGIQDKILAGAAWDGCVAILDEQFDDLDPETMELVATMASDSYEQDND